MNKEASQSKAPLISSICAILLAATALAVSMYQGYQNRKRDAALLQLTEAVLMPQIEGKFREVYKDFGVDYPEGATTIQDMGAPLVGLIEQMQEETP